jgi:hypothetical protein
MNIREEFAIKIAKVMKDLKSSHCYFILQMAYGEELSWEEAEELFDKVIDKNRTIKPKLIK